MQYLDLEVGQLDPLDSSPPCRGFSICGIRDIQDQRKDLFLETVRFIGGLRPKVLWQTVDWLKQHGLSSKDRCNWAGQISDSLWRGKVGAALQSCIGSGQQMELASPADKSQTQLGESSLQSFYLYLRNNLNSIVDYHSYRKKGCYPSSVLVEKAIALLVCRRLKLRGQNWGQQGADHLLVFRQMMLNVQWSNYWPERKTAGVSHSHTISHAYIMTDK